MHVLLMTLRFWTSWAGVVQIESCQHLSILKWNPYDFKLCFLACTMHAALLYEGAWVLLQFDNSTLYLLLIKCNSPPLCMLFIWIGCLWLYLSHPMHVTVMKYCEMSFCVWSHYIVVDVIVFLMIAQSKWRIPSVSRLTLKKNEIQ
jgi:hypothetical protein